MIEIERWTTLGEVVPTTLTQARLQAHWAAQVASAAGTTHAQARDDYGHTNLAWDRARQALVGRSIGERGLRAALRVADLHLLVMQGESAIAQRDLTGASLDEATVWLQGALCDADPSLRGSLVRPEHDMPAHPVQRGERFDPPRSALRELACWLDVADALASAAAVTHGGSEARCWPHHFDLATLISLDAGLDTERARSLGVGVSLGDGAYSEPYVYVTPWPYPDTGVALPELAGGGHWHREGWTGAVLLGGTLTAGLRDDQSVRAAAFVDSAIAAGLHLL